MTTEFQTHDLLQVDSDGVDALCSVVHFASLPLKDFPFVVVRRATQKDGLLPVGIRGMERHERCAAWLDPRYVLARVTPESIEPSARVRDLPAFQAFLELKRHWRDAKLAWGPGGSVAFELVSGCRVVREASDLDIVIRTAEPLSMDRLRILARLDNNLPCAVDVQVETLHGAFSPKEYVASSTRCMLRTVHGPRLVEDPWLRESTWERAE